MKRTLMTASELKKRREMMKLDWDKPIQTRDGRKARIICHDRINANCPARKNVCLIINGTSEDSLYVDDNGEWGNSRSKLDIINVPEEHEVEMRLCITPRQNGSLCRCIKDDKERCVGMNLIAKKKITIREGEGLG